jgi:hypothetical protein
VARHSAPKQPAKAALHLGHLKLPDKINACKRMAQKAASSPLLATSKPLHAAHQAFQKATEQAEHAVATHEAAKSALAAAEKDVAEKEAALIKAASGYRDAVEHVAQSDAATIDGLGLTTVPLRNTSAKTIGPPEGLEAKPGKAPGEITLSWKKADHAKSYVVQTTAEPSGAGNWEHTAAVTKTKTLLQGESSGKRLWVRVSSVGPLGESAFSPPVVVTVP